MCNLFYFVFVFGFVLPLTGGQCTLPFTDGTWISSTRGTWTVTNNGSRIQNFNADLSTTYTTATLDCISNSGTKYVLGTQFELFFLVTIDVYTCLDIQTIDGSPNSYVYFIVTPTDSSTGEQFTSDQASVCSNSNYNSPINTHVAVKSGSEAAASTTLPNSILGNYSVEYVDVNSATITGSTMDSCTDKSLMTFNNSDPSTKLAFTNGDLLHGIYSVSSGSTVYLHTYNNDTTVDSVNTFRIACWVIVKSGTQVKATVFPNECIQEQTSTSVAYGGQKFVFTPYYTCAPTEESTESNQLEGWQIALIVLGTLAALFIIIIIILCLLYVRKSRHVRDENDKEGFVDKERQPSPDSLNGDESKHMKDNDDPKLNTFDGKIDEITLEKRKNKEKEKIFHLKEVTHKPDKTSNKLTDINPTKEHIIKDDVPKIVKPADPVTPRTQQKPSPTPHPPRAPSSRKATEHTEITPRKKSLHPDIPPGKKSIPPTTPRPEPDDTTLLRIKRGREKKERERDERKKKEQAKEKKDHAVKKDDVLPEGVIENKVVIKTRHSSSSEEYETDDEEKNERIQKLFEKRKRLEATTWSPTGAGDSRVIGKKKRRKNQDGEALGELANTITTREEQEMLANRRRNRKKNLKKMAKKKLRSPSDVETTDTDGEGGVSRKRSKRRKVVKTHGVEAPYTKVYHEKKGIERELDDIDFWQTKHVPTVISDDDDSDSPQQFRRERVRSGYGIVKPMNTESKQAANIEGKQSANIERLIQEESDRWETFGMKELVIDMDGTLPEGFHFDDEGNVVRTKDGKKLPKEEYDKQMENRKKFGHVFSIPRLLRDADGRPVGGYKNDEFGPYEEWDFGELLSGKEEDEDHRRAESQRPTSGRQVAFSVIDGVSAPPDTPLTEADYNIIKGRQLGSAERLKLNERLFEAKQKQETEVPIFFANIKKGGVKSDPVYVDAKQLVRQDCNKPPTKPNTGNNSNMIKRSDTFDDGRMKLRRNTRNRSSWSGREATIPDFIPEEPEADTHQPKGIQGMTRSTHNIGSADEFILVGGSMQKLDKSQSQSGEGQHGQNSSKWCQRYERHKHQPSREITNLTDVSMRTAPDSVRPFSGDEKRLRKLMPEFYPDQKYFQHYLDTEKLPTNAALETRDLASHGREYLMERAGFWQEHQPVNIIPPPSELGLRLSRMRTFHTTAADSGMHSMISSRDGRPHSADDAGEPTHRTWTDVSRETTRTTLQHREGSHVNENSIQNGGNTSNAERAQLTGRSVATSSPSKTERSREKTMDETPPKSENRTATADKTSERKPLPGNVLSLTDNLDAQ